MDKAVEAINLTKEFQVFQSRKGLAGAFRDLLNRNYRIIRAVDQINLSIEHGEMVGYIGENGAGKSTTIKMLTGILQPTSGDLKVNGYHPHDDREQFVRTIGVVFGQRSQLWWDIAVQESFGLLQKIYRVDEQQNKSYLNHMIEVLDIGELLDQPVRKLSLGQRMRCELAAALIHKPSLLFLDEPTIGLDVLVKEKIRQFLREVNKELGTTIMLTTHDLMDIEALCSRVVMLDQGKIIYDGDLTRLKEEWGKERKVHLELESSLQEKDRQSLMDSLPIRVDQVSEKKYTVHIPNNEINVSNLLEQMLAKGIHIQEMQIEESTTEEIVRRIYSEGMESE